MGSTTTSDSDIEQGELGHRPEDYERPKSKVTLIIEDGICCLVCGCCGCCIFIFGKHLCLYAYVITFFLPFYIIICHFSCSPIHLTLSFFL